MAMADWIRGRAPRGQEQRQEQRQEAPAGSMDTPSSNVSEEHRDAYQKYLDKKADPRIEPFLRMLRSNGLIECGTNPRRSTLQTRIKIQAFAYLAQECFGLKFRYRHTLFTHGVYASGLANDYYRITDIDDIPDGGLGDWDERGRFLEFAREHSDAEWLEIASTLVYIHKETPMGIDDLIARAKMIKRKYTRGRIKDVWCALKDAGCAGS